MPFLRPIRMVSLCLCLSFATGCQEGSGGGPFSTGGWPIVDGVREPGERSVVFLVNSRGAGCTGTAISPRVVLTAKHCVLGSRARDWTVYVGSSPSSMIAEYGVSETRTTPGSSIEESDIALLILSEDFGYPIKRWEYTRWPGFMRGAIITAIGFGMTDPADPYSSGTKYRRDGQVVEISGTREFVTLGENTCQGDSGGPILFEDVVVGIVSRGEEGCTGYGIMTRVSGFADMINQALTDTGGCAPTGAEVCDGVDNDCWGDIDDDLAACACADGGAGGGEVCNGVDDDCNVAIDDIPSCACTGGAAPGAEVCNGIDDDCNGSIDEVCSHLGDSCTSASECSTGLCLDVGGSMICTARCTAGAGAACPEGGYCDGPACAADGGLCRLGGAGGGSVGAPCSGNGDCATGFCSGDAVSPPWRCVVPCVPGSLDCRATEACASIAEGCGACVAGSSAPTPRGFGEPCASDADCVSGYCFVDGDPAGCGEGCAYRYCTVSCDGGCPAGSHCREGVCVRGEPSDPGETCVADEDCTDGTVCIVVAGTGRCVRLCGEGDSCAAGTSCTGGVCWPDPVQPGDPCGDDGACPVGSCVPVADSILCVPPCDDVTDCPSGMSCVPASDGIGAFCLPNAVAGTTGGGGGGGCDCAVPGSASSFAAGPLALLGLLAVLARRRRRGRRHVRGCGQ